MAKPAFTLVTFAVIAAVRSVAAGAEPAIVRAAYLGDEKAVAAAIAAHAAVNAADDAGGTALLYGVRSEAIERELLEHGANPNVAAKDGMTPLIAAAGLADSYGTVKLLLEHGADVHAKLKDWEAALPHAVYGGDARTIRLLLDHGAPAGITGAKTLSPLVTAAYMGDLPTIKLLLDRGANPNDNAGFAGHALNHAFYAEHPDCAAELIRRGSDVTFASVQGAGTPPMVFAAYHQTDPALARLLVEHGAAIGAANEDGATALTYALRLQPDSSLVAYLRSMGLKEPAAHEAREALPPATPVELTDAALRPRLQRAVAALQVSSDAFLARGFVHNDAHCVSCHQQSLPAVAALVVAERGVPVDLAPLGRSFAALRGELEATSQPMRELRMDAIPDPSLVLGYPGLSLAVWRQGTDPVLQNVARYLMAQQLGDGSWASHDIRPPIEDGPILGTAFAARFVASFAGPEAKAAADESVARARHFLETAKPDTLNRQVFQLLGLFFTGAPAPERAALAQALIARQLPDGGWEQMPGRGSDAWATGSALVALYRAIGMPVTDPVYQKGAAFLVRTQGADGTWWVHSRTWPFQPHFDGKFAHGKDQWISAAGTSWAAIALSYLVDKPAKKPALPDVAGLIALAGSAPKGSEPEAKAADGVMLAKADPAQFRRSVAPIFERSCNGCHGGEKHRGGLSLASRDGLLKGGQSGDPAVVVGNSGQSQLIDFVTDKVEDLEMPPLERRSKYPALTPNEVSQLKAWIDAGMPWDAPGATPAGALH